MNDKNNNGMNLFLAALGGALVGAALVFFSDEKRRNQVKDEIDNLKAKGEEMAGKLRDKLEDGKEMAKKNIVTNLKKAQKRVEKA